ncbi:MAG: pseudouridine synthase [Bacteroidales bacterium]|jgi:23S rRNA pseudouridine2605 synthase
MERQKHNYGSNKPERGHSPYKKKEGFVGRDNEKRGDSRSKRPRINSEDKEERPRRSFSNDQSRRGGFAGSRDERPRRTFDNDRPKRSFDNNREDRPSRSFGENRDERPRRSFDNDRPKRSFDTNREDRPSRSFGGNREERPRRSFDNDRPKRSFDTNREDRPSRSFDNDRPKRSFDTNREDRPSRSFDNDRPKRSFSEYRDERPKIDFDTDRPKISFDNNREERPRRDFDNDRPRRSFDNNREERPRRDFDNDRPRRSFDNDRPKRSFSENRGERPRRSFDNDRRKRDDFFEVSGNSQGYDEVQTGKDGLIRLNKYISNSGICSRREADELIKAGAVTVNGEVVTEMGYKVTVDDVVVYGGERLANERKKYLLLNKPKGYITTLDDPQNRKTVLSLIDRACKERLYPVGRLDRNTTGLLLFTNDGEMTKKLTHPSFGARKIYHVELDKALTHADMQQIMDGIELEDGRIVADDVQYVGAGDDKKIVGIELHSGKNRIVRRIFASLGYEVFKLDRVAFAGLNKKALPRGQFRFLTDKEVGFLKMLKAN